MGSHSYGVADTSAKNKIPDYDMYGFCMPPLDYIFPSKRGEIIGFGTAGPKFEQWQQHGIHFNNKEYDFQVFNIVKYFELCRQGNPNMIDSLFTPETCVTHCNDVGRLVKDNRKKFLSKLVFQTYKGYSYSQMHKMRNKKAEGNRKEVIEKWGYDLHFAYHIVRLLDEVEQIMSTGDLDLQRAKEMLKSIRRGEWTLDQIIEWFDKKKVELDIMATNCKLPDQPDEEDLRQLLLKCLEMHYGSLDKIVVNDSKNQTKLNRIQAILEE
jgi:predicted nucleotidyltransferase